MPYQPHRRPQPNYLIDADPSTSGLIEEPAFSERFLDSLPGLGVVLAAALCIGAAQFAPRTMVYGAGVLTLYLALRLLVAGVANLRGLRRIARAQLIDWESLPLPVSRSGDFGVQDVRHVVIIPNFQESFQLLSHTLEHLAAYRHARSRMAIILAMEAEEAGAERKAERLKAKFEHRFAEILFTLHPAGLPGELRCKSANLSWASRWLHRRGMEQLGWDPGHVVVTVMDADTIWHTRYFDALSWYFAADDNRYQRFWQAPIRYHGDIFATHPILRPLNAYATSIELAYLTAPWWLSMPMSSYSLSLRLLTISDFWDPDVIADEWHMYIKAFFSSPEHVEIQPIYLPFLAAAVNGNGFWDTARNRYHQTLRHAWGSKEVGYTIAEIAASHRPANRRSLRLLLSVAHDVMISGPGWVIVTLGSELPPLFHRDLLEQYLNRGLYFPQTFLLELSFVIMAVLAGLFLIIDFRVRPPRPSPPGRRERLQEIVGLILLPLLAVVFVALPVLQAQLMLLMGKTLDFRVTRK